ncbi:MAG: hypothetical protein E5V33_30370, partial [Mesorhizobium sp.]
VTLVLNQRSVAKPYVDDNRMFYLAADNDHDREWVNELADDVWNNQLPAYRRFAEQHPAPQPVTEPVSGGARESW